MPAAQHQYPGLFIALEGIDGAGKSWATTRLEVIARKFDDYDPVVVREPGGTEFGEAMREILTVFRREISVEAQAMCFGASRKELADLIIGPALQQGRTVITDRWTPSTRVYQSNCAAALLDTLINAAAGDLVDADLTLLFTRDPVDAVAAKRHEFDETAIQQEIDYLTRMQDQYREQMRTSPARWVEFPFATREEATQRLETIYRELHSRTSRRK